MSNYTGMRALLGEGVHTARRKAGDSKDSLAAYRAIDEMDPEEWSQVLDSTLRGLLETGVEIKLDGTSVSYKDRL